MVPDPSLTPELIQARAFTQGFRGYDHSEVRDFLNRIAAEVKALRERAEQLESAWRSAEERAARPPVLDEDTLMAAVGEETASILRSARAAAADMKSKAAVESEHALSASHEEADRIRAEAETVLADERKKADEAASGIVETAREEATQLVESARGEAESVRAKAEQERALTIEGANSTRERILDDLGRRRRVATVQIEQLRAGRERLLEAYSVVRRTLEEAQEELSRADAEARAAADDAGRRLRHETELPDHHDDDAGLVEEALVVAEQVASEARASGGRGGPVDELFARIRGTQDSVVEAPSEAADAPDGHSEAAAVGEPAIEDPPGTEPMGTEPVRAEPLGAESWLQRRETGLVNLETGLTRRLKRALQDEQNDLLDRLRGLRGEPSAAALLPPHDEHTARYTQASLPLVEQAASAGASFAGDVLESTNPAGVEVEDLAADAASTIVDPLRRRLEHLISSGAGEEQSVLVESLGAAYREWKSHRIERVAGDVLSAAFSRGTWNASPDGTAFRWIVEDVDGPCPDCDDDALAGDLPKGEPFPTGQPHPPAHSGCRCLLVPVSAGL